MPPLQQPPSDPAEAEAAIDHIGRLPDDLLLDILNYVWDIRSLGRCYAVSRRFRLLVGLISSLRIPIDCIIFIGNPVYDYSPALLGSPVSTDNNTLYFLGFPFVSAFICSLVSRLVLKPLQSPVVNSSISAPGRDPSSFTHHTLVQVLKDFSDLRTLHIVLPSSELPLNDPSPLLRWHAHFGSSLHRCLILAAASTARTDNESAVAVKDTIPDSLYAEVGVTLTIASLFAASKRQYLLQPVIMEHTTLESLVVTDGDGQGVLRMDRDQLEELRKKPISASSQWTTMIPAFRMRLWYAPVVELSCGWVLEGATLVVANRLSSGSGEEEEDIMGLDGWIEEEFNGDGVGMYAEAARMLVKDERTHYLEMNSFGIESNLFCQVLYITILNQFITILLHLSLFPVWLGC